MIADFFLLYIRSFLPLKIRTHRNVFSTKTLKKAETRGHETPATSGYHKCLRQNNELNDQTKQNLFTEDIQI